MSETVPPKVTCPKCGSDQIHAGRKTPSSVVTITCLNCGHEFKPGDKANEELKQTEINSENAKKRTSGCIILIFVIGLVIAIYYALGVKEPDTSLSPKIETSTSSTLPSDPYEVIHTAFEGFPDIEIVKPMLEDVMKATNVPINNDRILKCANVLVGFKNDSKVGVTEMEILKDMYQKRRASDYVTSAAMSAVYLETTK